MPTTHRLSEAARPHVDDRHDDVRGTRPRVLLVDDNSTILESCSAILGRHCTVVGTAGDGRRALDLALALRPDVIVLDVSLPDICGVDLAARLNDAGSSAA